MQSRTQTTMGAWKLYRPGSVERGDADLRWEQATRPRPAADEVVLAVGACGVCHTDLHIVERDIEPPAYPVIPGHQVVGRVAERGANVPPLLAPPPDLDPRARDFWSDHADALRVVTGARFGVGWFSRACGACAYCRAGRENLCPHAAFTGFSRDGGFADFLSAPATALIPLPPGLDDIEAAPLLCAGIIGYRALRLAGGTDGPPKLLGLFGFGASAHLAIQVARNFGHRVFVFTRSAAHRELATALGAEWTGPADAAPPEPLDAAVTFAPVGHVAVAALAVTKPGGTVVVNAIHLAGDIPAFPYARLYGERVFTSVTNYTRRDAWEFMYHVVRARIRPTVEAVSRTALPQALVRLRAGAVQGSIALDFHRAD